MRDRTVALGVGLGLLLGLPTLAVGFSNDDLLQRLELEGFIPGYEGAWLRLYDFTPPKLSVSELERLGYLPWFSAKDLSLRFFRPLSSALLALDEHAFGRSAVAAHLHSLVWFGLLVAVTSMLYRRWFRGAIATWATVVYATAGLHSMSTAWLAARHSMISTAFAVTALWAHARTREEGWRAGPWLTAIALALGLCAGETAVGALVFLAAYELFRPASRRERLEGVAMFAALAVAYLGAYALAGYGVRHSRMYVSPLADPGLFASVAPTRIAVMMAELFAALPSEVPTIVPAAAVPLAIVGVVAFAGITGALWRLRSLLDDSERRHLVWLGSAGIASLLPMASVMPGGRLLPLALVGTAPLVGAALVVLARARPRWRTWPALGVLALLHLVVSPLVRVVQTLAFREFARSQKTLAEQADISRCGQGSSAYLITGADPSLSLYAGPALLFHTPKKAHGRWFMISPVPEDQRLTRVGPGAIELSAIGPRTANDFERLYSDHGVNAGDRVHVDGLDVEVLAADHGLFTRARFELAGDLDRGESCLLAWQGKRLVAITPPAVGASAIVRHEPGPMAL